MNATIVYEDEATFRQDATLHTTWSKCGVQPLIPNTGQRKSIKVFGCVDLFRAKFYYRTDERFNADSYIKFLEQIGSRFFPKKVLYIQDNAAYHKDSDVWTWFNENRKWIEVYNLPPYSPELNATERLWHHTRVSGTHNRYFDSVDNLYDTLISVFRSMQKDPRRIEGYLKPFL